MALKHIILTVSLILVSSEAVFACRVADTASADSIYSESLSDLRAFHALIVASFVLTLIIFVARRVRGWLWLVLGSLVLLVSPGWFAMQNAGINADCSPSGSAWIKAIFAITFASLAMQVVAWYRKVESRVI